MVPTQTQTRGISQSTQDEELGVGAQPHHRERRRRPPPIPATIRRRRLRLRLRLVLPLRHPARPAHRLLLHPAMAAELQVRNLSLLLLYCYPPCFLSWYGITPLQSRTLLLTGNPSTSLVACSHQISAS